MDLPFQSARRDRPRPFVKVLLRDVFAAALCLVATAGAAASAERGSKDRGRGAEKPLGETGSGSQQGATAPVCQPQVNEPMRLFITSRCKL